MIYRIKKGYDKQDNYKIKGNMPNKPLTAKATAFCKQYPIDNNGTQAAIRAGFSVKTAAAAASRLLRNVKIMQRIDEVRAEIAMKTGWTIEQAQEMLLETRFRAIRLNQPAVEVSSVVSINRMFGYDKDNDMGSKDKPIALTDADAAKYAAMADAAIADKVAGPTLSKETA